MTAFGARFVVLQAVGLAGLLALWAGGRLDVLTADRTGLTLGIAAARSARNR